MPNGNGSKTVRIGLMSRIDYGSDGFRRGLVNLAARVFARENVDFVVLVGGLISARAIKEKSVKLGMELRLATRQLNNVLKEIKRAERMIDTAKPKEAAALREHIEKLLRQEDALMKRKEHLDACLAELKPENLAKQLDEALPSFTNAKGETVKLWVITSAAYDHTIGEEVARLLSDVRSKREMRLLSSGDDHLQLWPEQEDKRWLEILTPIKAAWLRGDFFSTPVERVLKDKRRQTSRPQRPDVDIVGCFGSTITKPAGEIAVPYVSLPVLHRIQETTVNENQTGVRVMELSLDRREPVMRNYSFKDLVGRERSFIGSPASPSADLKKILDEIRREGKRTTGMLHDKTGLEPEAIRKMLKPLVVKKGGKPRKSWSGLVYDEHSDRWDFDLDWVQRYLEYPEPKGELKNDSIVAFGCLHAGSVNTGYEFFMRSVPKRILERNANVLIAAGDLVEGVEHDLDRVGETVGGLNVTRMEAVAAWMMHKVMFEVFQVRFDKGLEALKASGKEPDAGQIAALVRESIILLLYILGNHDEWMLKKSWSPLAYMSLVIRQLLTGAIEEYLLAKGLRVDRLAAIVRDKVVNPSRGEFILPSGLKLTIKHPHMSRTKTTSIRLQETLDNARDSHVTVIANFHVGEHLEMWETGIGQRVCLELGTIKNWTSFEDGKLKTVDQSFGFVRIGSLTDQETSTSCIIVTENTFYTNEKGSRVEEQPEEFVRKVLEELKKLGIEY